MDYNYIEKKDYTNYPILDFAKMKSSSWRLYFTGGKILEDNLITTIRPTLIKLDRQDIDPSAHQLQEFQIFFNTLSKSVDVRPKADDLCNQDHLLGSFVVVDCQLRFTIPVGLCEKYIRAFSGAFDKGYDIGSRIQDICKNWCGSFDFEFKKEQFETTCELGKTDNGKLACWTPYDTTKQYFTATVVECKNTIQ